MLAANPIGVRRRFLTVVSPVTSDRFSIAANVKPRPITSYRRCLALRLTSHTGLSLLFEVGIRPPHDGMRRWGGPICGAPLPQISGRFSRHYELTPPVVPVRTFFCRSRTRDLLDSGFSCVLRGGSGNRRNWGAVLTPAELATVNPHPVQNHGQAPGDRDDGSTYPAPLSHPYAPGPQPRPFPALDKQ